MGPGDKIVDPGTFHIMKHDIKNQLSNISLITAQLKYELKEAPAEQLEYLEMIALTVSRIDDILNANG